MSIYEHVLLNLNSLINIYIYIKIYIYISYTVFTGLVHKDLKEEENMTQVDS